MSEITELNELMIQEEQTDLAPIGTRVDLKQCAKLARTYASSTMVPIMYQANPSNCFLACELAMRMGLSPTFVMQNLIIVQGKPAWNGQSCVAMINGCGKFRNVKYVEVGEKGKPSWGCRVEAVRQSDGEKIAGTTVTLQMAMDEGWYNKSGSKWKTMPEQMLKYRAASFFARSEIPQLLMGFYTNEEIVDVNGAPESKQEEVVFKLESNEKESNEE